MMSKCLICYRNDLPDGQHYHPACSRKFFGSVEPPTLDFALSDMKELARNIVQSQRIVTGVQPKISLGIAKNRNEGKRLTLMTGDYILKPPSVHYREMPEVEDLTMQLAKQFGIRTVPHALIPLKSGELAYITRRIDRSPSVKVHMEDFCQLSELLTEDKYKSSMERVGKLVVRYSRYAGLDLVNLFELTVFNFLTGNNDMHLKNFSLIYDEQGWHLSPAYDLLNVNLVNPADKEETALTINGKKQKLVVADFIALGRSYQLTDKQMSHVFRKFGDTSRTEEWIDRSFLSDPFKSEYVRMMRERASRLN